MLAELMPAVPIVVMVGGLLPVIATGLLLLSLNIKTDFQRRGRRWPNDPIRLARPWTS